MSLYVNTDWPHRMRPWPEMYFSVSRVGEVSVVLQGSFFFVRWRVDKIPSFWDSLTGVIIKGMRKFLLHFLICFAVACTGFTTYIT
jgi:hypothetical protein